MKQTRAVKKEQKRKLAEEKLTEYRKLTLEQKIDRLNNSKLRAKKQRYRFAIQLLTAYQDKQNRIELVERKCGVKFDDDMVMHLSNKVEQYT